MGIESAGKYEESREEQEKLASEILDQTLEGATSTYRESLTPEQIQLIGKVKLEGGLSGFTGKTENGEDISIKNDYSGNYTGTLNDRYLSAEEAKEQYMKYINIVMYEKYDQASGEAQRDGRSVFKSIYTGNNDKKEN